MNDASKKVRCELLEPGVSAVEQPEKKRESYEEEKFERRGDWQQYRNGRREETESAEGGLDPTERALFA